jgi:hypothetical protein
MAATCWTPSTSDFLGQSFKKSFKKKLVPIAPVRLPGNGLITGLA